jgi:hypothetical protein
MVGSDAVHQKAFWVTSPVGRAVSWVSSTQQLERLPLAECFLLWALFKVACLLPFPSLPLTFWRQGACKLHFLKRLAENPASFIYLPHPNTALGMALVQSTHPPHGSPVLTAVLAFFSAKKRLYLKDFK